MALRRFGLPCLIFAAAFVAFLPALSADFLNWDDDVNFLTNPNFRGLGWENLRWMATTTHQGHWIPLSWLTLGVNYALGGMDPWGYHLLNLLFHAASAVLFYFAARRLISLAREGFGEPALSAGAAFAALLFAVHPLRVESVVWVTERRDVQSVFFFLLSALAYLRAVERGGDGGLAPVWRRLSVAAFVGALMSKSSTLMLPAALLLLDFYPPRRVARGWRRLILEKLPYLVLAAADMVVVWIAVLQREAEVSSLAAQGVAGRVAMVFYSFFYYPWKLVWPVELSPMYEMPERIDPLQTRFVVALLLVVLITAALVALRRRWPAGLTAWTYSALMILPLSGVVHVGDQLVQDRWSYLSGMGFNIVAGAGVAWALDARARGRVSPMIARSVVAAAAALVLVLAAGSWDQSKVWQDSETLWRWSVNLDHGCSICWNNLGTSLSLQKRHAEAEVAFRQAFALRPRRALLASNVATALHGQNKVKEAEEMFHLALGLDPNLPRPLASLGAVYAQQGRYAESLPYYRRAFAQDPEFAGLASNYSRSLVARAAEERRAGRTGIAMALLQEALAVNPADAEARRQLQALPAEPAGPGSSR